MDRIDRSGTGIATLGRDEDQFLAHVALGERVVPPVISASTQARINQEMRAAGLDPNEYAVGSGMSINPITGLPEFGFLKKAFKSVKKVVKKVAPVAMLVPGVGTAFGAALGGLGGLAGTALTKVGLGGVASTLGSLGSSALSGIAGLNIPGFSSIAGGAATPGAAFEALKAGGLRGAFAGGPLGGLLSQTPELTPVSDTMDGPITGYMDAAGKMYTPQEAAALTQAPNFFGGGEKSLYGNLGQPLLDVNGQPIVNDQGQPINRQGQPISQTTQSASSLFGGLGGLGGGNLGSLGLAGFLGKMAYDSAKKKEGGISETPKVTMDQLGRYQLSKELGTGGTRGEFGLGPKPAVLNVAGGGEARQYFNEGGLAAVQELDMRDGGESEGPGTGTSDDIPAMLSDGEFVMTAAATKGAGAFNVNKTKSGIELISGGSASREKGVENMRELMNIFEAV